MRAIFHILFSAKLLSISFALMSTLLGCDSTYDIKHYERVVDVKFKPEDFIVTCDLGIAGKNEIIDQFETCRPDCVIKTPAVLACAENQIAEVQVDYETRWSTYVIPLQDIHIHRLARVDLKYDVNAESKIISEFIAPPNVRLRAIFPVKIWVHFLGKAMKQ